MNTKFTPGPWEYDGKSRIDAVQFRKPTGHICEDGSEYIGGLVALPYHCGALGRGDTHEANARLIAAAPELLEALGSMLEDVGRASSLPSAVKARAAIAKALGNVEQAKQDREAA